MKIQIKAGDLMELGLWERYCNVHGINSYAMNEGMMASNEWVEISLEELDKWRGK